MMSKRSSAPPTLLLLKLLIILTLFHEKIAFLHQLCSSPRTGSPCWSMGLKESSKHPNILLIVPSHVGKISDGSDQRTLEKVSSWFGLISRFTKSSAPIRVEVESDELIFRLLDQADQKQTSIYLSFEESNLSNHVSEEIRNLATYHLHLFHEEEEEQIKSNERRLKDLIHRIRSLESKDIALRRPPLELEAGRYSHFLSLTYSDLSEALPDLTELRKGIDAFELRVYLLADQSSLNIQRQIALLKRAYPDLPIIYTVRTMNQIGRFPDYDYDRIKQLLMEGVKAGVEWLDVEANLPLALIKDISYLVKPNPRRSTSLTRLIGSYHTRNVCSDQEIQRMFDLCQLSGAADILKVVTGAEKKEDSLRLHRIGQLQSKPYIGLCLGDIGSYSRVLNERFTPVTHERMKTPAAPGQLTVKQLQAQRLSEGLISQRQYYLFGHPIQHSLSPKLHNTAYEILQIPSSYSLKESEKVEIYKEVLTSEQSFHGASVTIPHKETIIQYLDEISPEATAIGAVNTVRAVDRHDEHSSVTSQRRLYGFNTDWLGMYKPIVRLLQGKDKVTGGKQHTKNEEEIGLVIGAGGTARAACYVIKQLGYKLYLANRTPEKALELAERFEGTVLSFDQLSQVSLQNVKVIISTLPASAGFTLPSSLLEQQPIVLDVVYKPALTPLLQQAKANDCPVVQGATMLLEQAIEQFQIWNERLAPREEMKTVLFENVEKIDSTD